MAPAKRQPFGLLGRGSGSGLPSGYLAAEFLESTGTQYLMTGFFPDDTAEIKIDINPLSAPQNLSIWLFTNANLDRTEGGRSLKAAASPQGNLYFEYGSMDSTGTFGVSPIAPSFGERRIIELKNGYYDTGSRKGSFNKQVFSTNLVELSIFRNIRDTTLSVLDIYSCILTKSGERKRDFTPMLDKNGTPCMYDKITKKPFYNSGTGQFIVGMTLKQARKLSKLPSTGGSLTVSLPWEAQLVQHNGEVESALGTAQGNGWLVGVQYRDAESDSAVYNKYNECTIPTKVKEVNADYGTDLTADGEWIYPLSNLKSGTDDWVVGLFTDAAIKNVDMEFPAMLYADYLFFNNKTLESAILYLPNATTLNRVLTQTKNMTYAEIKLNGQGVTKCYDVISRGSKTKKIKVWNVGEWVGSSCFRESPNLEEFEFEAQKLTSMHAWFNNNYKLRRVSINDVSKVTTGYQCYDNCYVLEEFPTVYPVLSDGELMFQGCRLKKQHAIEILNGIPAWSSGTHSITVGIHVDFKDDAEIAEAVASAEAKGWTVTVQWNGTAGTSGASTYGLRRQPIYAKVVEHDGKQNLDWGHYVTNAEENGYQEFASVEEAEEYFGIEKENNA